MRKPWVPTLRKNVLVFRSKRRTAALAELLGLAILFEIRLVGALQENAATSS